MPWQTFEKNVSLYKEYADVLSSELGVRELTGIIGSLDAYEIPIQPGNAYQPKIVINSEGRSGMLGSQFAHDLRDCGIEAFHQSWNRAPALFEGDILHSSSVSGTTPCIYQHAVASKKNIPALRLSCATSSTEGDVLYNLDNAYRIYVPGREKAPNPKDKRAGPLGNIPEWGIHITNDLSALGYRKHKKVKAEPGARRIVGEYIDGCLADNAAYTEDCVSSILSQRDVIEPMIEDTAGKRLLLVYGTGRAQTIANTLEMRAMHSGYNNPQKRVLGLNDPWSRKEAKRMLHGMSDEVIQEGVCAIVISREVQPEKHEFLNKNGIPAYYISYEPEAKTGIDEKYHIQLPRPKHANSASHGRISPFNPAAMLASDSIAAAWAKMNDANEKTNHK